MKTLLVCALGVISLSAAQAEQTFTGTIIDSLCARGGHAQMQMGANDAECTTACIDAHGATYVLLDGLNVYELSDQKTPEKFAGQKVAVVGKLDGKTRKITVSSIRAAN